MRGSKAKLGTLVLLSLFLLAATLARADEITQKGNLRVQVSGKLSPKALPRTGSAPVSVSVSGQISTLDETQPPVLQKLKIEINRHGRLDTQGLPTCKVSQIQPGSNARALHACRSALVGRGAFAGTVTLPGAEPYEIEGKLLLFNGKEKGHPVLLGHIYSPHPFATSFVIVFEISTEHKGTYGTVLSADLRKTLGDKRNLTSLQMTLKRTFHYKGSHHSYISAACPAPKGFNKVPFPLARTSFSFADGTKLTSTLTRTCEAKG